MSVTSLTQIHVFKIPSAMKDAVREKGAVFMHLFVCLSDRNVTMWTVGIMMIVLGPEFRAAASVG